MAKPFVSFAQFFTDFLRSIPTHFRRDRVPMRLGILPVFELVFDESLLQ